MQVPRIHPETIEAVQQGVDIVEVISDYVVLKKKGKDYSGLCPFHNEKTPSFSVSQDKQLYYCFGCGAGGNTFKFLMEIGKQSFAEVVLDLARRYQIPIQTVEPEQRQDIQRQLTLREQLYEVLAVATNFFQHALHQSPGEVALNYLKETRNLADSTINSFELGYAPGGWETLYRYLVEQKRYPVSLVAEAGLIKQRKEGNGYYDVFRDRVIIPIKDTQGRVIGFGSRTLQEENQPKYLNSPETPLFDKGKTLFALDRARKSVAQEDRVIVVEGYFDVIALHVAGITNVVASLGTAFTDYQLKQLLRYTPSKQVILNFDADKAGIKATERAIAEVKDLVYAGQVQLRVLNLPGGKDADEFISSSDDAIDIYRDSVDDAPLWLDWQINNLITGKNLKAADEMQQVAKGVVKLLNRLQDANQRNYYLNYCAEILSQGDGRLVPQNLANLKAQLAPEFRKKSNLRTNKKQIKTSPKIALSIATSPEEELLEQAESLLLLIYIHCPRYRDNIISKLEDKDLYFTLPNHRFLWQEIITIEQEKSNKQFALDNFILEQLHNRSVNFSQDMKSLTNLFYLDEKAQEDVFRAAARIENAIASLEQVSCIKYQLYCTEQLENINPLVDGNKIQHLYEEIQYSKKRLQELEKIRLSAES
ncbi:DNA primase [Hyella patelloides LEGE 07179]|uniref:DNA primase n=1 Tax=Hyella patelloides LEGE 07179 TaxID=945734 RepID=A0A563VVN1_9CYAN|nr:DNA primase [Hyella patelloides]VEP15461.1 DNA primase [Hyella patelloides LEGE 07179]